MARKPGKLYRTLQKAGISTPLITIDGDTFSASDDTIRSISIHSGTGDASPGIAPMTCETTIEGAYWTRTGTNLTVSLTQAAASALSSKTGVSINSIRRRFTGRVGRQENEDTPNRMSATMSAASWSAQLQRVNTSAWVTAGTPLDQVIRWLMTSPALPSRPFFSYGTFDVVAEDQGTLTYSDIDKFTSEIGILVRDTRDGEIQAWPLPYRASFAESQIPNRYPLTRSQAISPAIWETPNENLPAKIRADWIGADGLPVSRSAGGTEDSIVERHDWTYIKQQTEGLNQHFQALVAQNWTRDWQIPQIRVDILELLRSDKPYNLGQAGMLLALNAGDFIGLSGDWYEHLRGLHAVTAIDEKITADEWSLTLSLIPYSHVTGLETPAIPARIWESAAYPWDEETRKWNES